METKLIGRWGEARAADLLRQKGFTILSNGFSCRYGEIDIICQKGNLIVFVEVKTRKNSDFARASDNVTRSKQQRIIKTAQTWIMNNKCENPCRLDIIEVYYSLNGDTPQLDSINHIENAF